MALRKLDIRGICQIRVSKVRVLLKLCISKLAIDKCDSSLIQTLSLQKYAANSKRMRASAKLCGKEQKNAFRCKLCGQEQKYAPMSTKVRSHLLKSKSGYVSRFSNNFTTHKPHRMVNVCVVGYSLIFFSHRYVKAGQHVHGIASVSGLDLVLFVQSSLVHIHLKCNLLKDVRKLLDAISEPDMISWSALVSVYARLGHVNGA